MAQTEKPLAPVANPPASATPEIKIDETKTVTKKRERSTSPAETTLQALYRILGDAVLEIIPEGVQNAVEASHKFWQQHPDSFLVTDFDSQQSRNDALTVMKAYAEIRPGGPLTIRQDHDSAPEVLHWRAQTRQGPKPATE